MRRLVRTIHTVLAAAFVLATPSRAQVTTHGSSSTSAALPPLPATDSVFRRARRLVSDGDGASGRALVDSMLRASTEGSASYGNALFWRGALAETAADAERDYRRVIVEYPLSAYADDALLSLAELEQARGDRAAAYQHLQRFVREHPMGPARARAGLAAARLAFEQRDATRGCAMIADARLSAGTSDVELRNQIDYYGSRCSTSTVATAAPSPSAPTPPVSSNAAPSAAPTPAARSSSATANSAPPLSAKETTTAAKAPAAAPPKVEPPPTERARGIWTIQLAAYNTRPEAERLVRKLAGRGVNARISGDAKPFRVRLDYYPTHQAAAAVVADLKQRGIIGFVTDEPRTGGVARP